MTRPVSQRRKALLSVSDKSALIPFASGLVDLSVDLVSTGGTAEVLREAGLPVTDVSDLTGFPEIMDGRVKTLHPLVHGGLLARDGADDDTLAKHGIEHIDILVVNLYPFEETVASDDCTIELAIENIDIGGPAMLRAGAKNHSRVAVLVDSRDYDRALEELRSGEISIGFRRDLAVKAFGHTARYDAAINRYLTSQYGEADDFPESLVLSWQRVARLRYGENPHQSGAYYRDPRIGGATIVGARQLQGKPLSYNNVADADAALQCVRAFDETACVIVKHANPCGIAISDSSLEAYRSAYATDPTSAFGGIIAFNQPLDGITARTIIDQQFVEVIVAPEVKADARNILERKRNTRVLAVGDLVHPSSASRARSEIRTVSGGLLVQDADEGCLDDVKLEVVTNREPTPAELADLRFAWTAVKYVKSNAIVYARDGRTLGIGAGQMSRVVSSRIAAMKAADEKLEIAGAAMASDAFFPFRDGIDVAAEFGIATVIQPGGSVRDDEVIAAANAHGMAMILTGMRHFRH